MTHGPHADMKAVAKILPVITSIATVSGVGGNVVFMINLENSVGSQQSTHTPEVTTQLLNSLTRNVWDAVMRHLALAL